MFAPPFLIDPYIPKQKEMIYTGCASDYSQVAFRSAPFFSVLMPLNVSEILASITMFNTTQTQKHFKKTNRTNGEFRKECRQCRTYR